MTEPTLRQRPGDQPLPTPNQHPAIADLVQADLEGRRQLGVQRYGTPLQPHNGRDALRDLYEELLDGVCYLRQVMYERDASRETQWAARQEDGEITHVTEWQATYACEWSPSFELVSRLVRPVGDWQPAEPPTRVKLPAADTTEPT
jgi:hypothetical protein